MENLKVLIADDSLIYRMILKKVINAIDGVEVCHSVSNGHYVLKDLDQYSPDLLLLDVEMPVMGGLDVMKELSKRESAPDVIMCSAFTTEGADITIKALELGACDFITKTEGENRQESELKLLKQLQSKLDALRFKSVSGKTNSQSQVKKAILEKTKASHGAFKKPELVAIGISTGGPNALSVVIPALPENFPVPITIVQHMPPLFVESLATSLDRKSKLTVKVAEDGETLKGGTVYLAPGQKQLKIVREKNVFLVAKITDDPAENFCKPAADYMFRSVATACQGKSVGVIMTGMGGDGAKGLKHMHEAGAFIIGQDEKTSTIYGMPKEAYNADVVDKQLPLEQIAPRLIKLLS